MIRAGELNNRVKIQRLTTAIQSDGSSSETWADVATVWAHVKPLNGREYQAAQQAQAELTHTVYMWYLAGVAPADRLVFGTRIFDILDVVNVDERNVEMVLRVKEKI